MMAALRPDGAGMRLECVKAKDSEPFEPWFLHLEPTGDSCHIALGSNRGQLGDAERQIIECLTDAFGSNPAASTVLLRASGVAERSYYRALKTLEERGFITRSDSGRSTHITLTTAGSTALLPTTATGCQAGVPITACQPPSLGVGSGSGERQAV